MNFSLSDNLLELEFNLTKAGIQIIEQEGSDIELDFSNLRKKTAEEYFDINYQEGLLNVKEKTWRKSFTKPEFLDNDVITDLTLRIPKGTQLRGNIATVSGRISAQTLNLVGKIRTISGSIKLGDVTSKRIRIHNVGGSLSIKSLNGALSAKVISGDCHIESGNITNLSVGSVSGDVNITGNFSLKESGSIHTVSGDINLNILQYEGENSMVLSTLSGRTAIEGEYPNDKIEIKKRIPMLKNHPFKSIMPFMKNVVSSFSNMMDDSEVEVQTQTNEANEQHVRTILDMLSDGKITAEEAERLINALKGQ